MPEPRQENGGQEDSLAGCHDTFLSLIILSGTESRVLTGGVLFVGPRVPRLLQHRVPAAFHKLRSEADP